MISLQQNIKKCAYCYNQNHTFALSRDMLKPYKTGCIVEDFCRILQDYYESISFELVILSTGCNSHCDTSGCMGFRAASTD